MAEVPVVSGRESEDGEDVSRRRLRRANRTTDWGRVAYVTLALLTIAIAWALVLGSILVVRSGNTSNAMLEMLARNQQARERSLDHLREEGDESRARLEESRQRASDTYRRLAAQATESSRRRQATARATQQSTAEHAEDLVGLAGAALSQSRDRQQAVRHLVSQSVDGSLAQRRRRAAALRSAMTELIASQQQLHGLLRRIGSLRPALLIAHGSLQVVVRELDAALDQLSAAVPGTSRLEAATAIISSAQAQLAATVHDLTDVRDFPGRAGLLRSLAEMQRQLAQHLDRLREPSITAAHVADSRAGLRRVVRELGQHDRRLGELAGPADVLALVADGEALRRRLLRVLGQLARS